MAFDVLSAHSLIVLKLPPHCPKRVPHGDIRILEL
jgi:hypothetical protein